MPDSPSLFSDSSSLCSPTLLLPLHCSLWMSVRNLPGGLCISYHLCLNYRRKHYCFLQSTLRPVFPGMQVWMDHCTKSQHHLPTWPLPSDTVLYILTRQKANRNPLFSSSFLNNFYLQMNCDRNCGWCYPCAGWSLVLYRAGWASHEQQASKQHPPWPLPQLLSPGSSPVWVYKTNKPFHPQLAFGCSVLSQKE